MGYSKVDVLKGAKENWENYQAGRKRENHYKGNKYILKCVRCEKTTDLGKCPDCGADVFEPGPGQDGYPSLYCLHCDVGGKKYRCSCGTINLYLHTLYKKAGWF